MQQYSTFMPGPVAPPQVPNPTYSATTSWGRGKEMEQAAILAATVGNSGINHLINQKHQGEITSWLLKVWFYLKFLLVLATWNLYKISTNIHAFYTGHCKEQILN